MVYSSVCLRVMVCTHTRAHTHDTYTLTSATVREYTYICINAHTHARMHSRMHARTRSLSLSHTHTHSSDHLIVLMNICPPYNFTHLKDTEDEVSPLSSCGRAQVHLLSCVIWSQSYPLLLVQTACRHAVMSAKGCSLFSHGHVRGSSIECTPGYTHMTCE